METEVDVAGGTQPLTHVLQEFVSELMQHSVCDMLHIMREAGLSMPQLVTLLFLHRQGPRSLTEIRDHLNLTLSATSHLVDRLHDDGLVSRVEDLHDRRQKQIALTAAGLAFVAEVKLARVAEMARHLTELPTPLLNRLTTAMTDTLAYLHPNATKPV